MEEGILPLAGLRVIDAASFIAAPAAATILADFGADVIKVEEKGEGDPNRRLHQLAGMPPHEVPYSWALDSRGKRSLAVDLKTPAGREIILRLVRNADVFITNFPFPVRERLGLRYEDLAPLNERLIFASFSGYGETGPDRDRPGFDTNAYFARSGISHALRIGDGPPSQSVPGGGDRPTAISLFAGILMALMLRERTGKGTKVTSSLLANGLWANGVLAQAALLGAIAGPKRPRNDPWNAVGTQYRSRDGRWFVLNLVQEEKLWPRLCEAIGRPELATDPRFDTLKKRRADPKALFAILDPIFSSRDWADWAATLSRYGITFGLIAELGDIPHDEQAVHAGAVVPSTDPAVGRTIAVPFHVEGVARRPPGSAPRLGQDTDAILSELGFAAAEIAKLRADGVIA